MSYAHLLYLHFASFQSQHGIVHGSIQVHTRRVRGYKGEGDTYECTRASDATIMQQERKAPTCEPDVQGEQSFQFSASAMPAAWGESRRGQTETLGLALARALRAQGRRAQTHAGPQAWSRPLWRPANRWSRGKLQSVTGGLKRGDGHSCPGRGTSHRR
jgi:hypothetical protein